MRPQASVSANGTRSASTWVTVSARAAAR
jgi:hypothetical protein